MHPYIIMVTYIQQL